MNPTITSGISGDVDSSENSADHINKKLASIREYIFTHANAGGSPGDAGAALPSQSSSGASDAESIEQKIAAIRAKFDSALTSDGSISGGAQSVIPVTTDDAEDVETTSIEETPPPLAAPLDEPEPALDIADVEETPIEDAPLDVPADEYEEGGITAASAIHDGSSEA